MTEFFVFMIAELFYLRDQRNFGISRSTEFSYSRSTEFCYLCNRRNFLFSRSTDFCYVRDWRNFNVCDRWNRDRRNFYFRERRIKRSNQAIALGDRRIKRSIVSQTFKIREQEFSWNLNSGIPGKRSENKKKIPFHQAHNGAPKDLFQGLFSSLTQICLRRKSNEPFLNSCMGNTLQRGPEGKKIPAHHCT